MGNTLSYFLLGTSEKTYFGIMLALGLLGNLLFMFLPSV